MIISKQIESNHRYICDRRRNINSVNLYKFVSTVHLDSSWNRREENQLRKELASIPWKYIYEDGLVDVNATDINFTEEEYEVWKIKSYLTGLCKPL